MAKIYAVTTIVTANNANPYGALDLNPMHDNGAYVKDLPFVCPAYNYATHTTSTTNYTPPTTYPATIPDPSAAAWDAATHPYWNTFHYWLFGTVANDCQTPFYFNFSYPPNNYKLAEAHVVVDIARDASDTEGIFIGHVTTAQGTGGIFSGRPPGGHVNDGVSGTSSAGVSTKLLYETSNPSTAHTAGTTATSTYFIDRQIAHYKIATRNSSDFLIGTPATDASDSADDHLIHGTPVKVVDLVNNSSVTGTGQSMVPVVVGDDSTVYNGQLVLKGYTISSNALSCVNSPTYSFQNTFLFNDGNSIGTSAFSGTVFAPLGSWSAATTAHSVEWFYDTLYPQVDTANLTISSATIAFGTAPGPNQIKKDATGSPSAIVVNGVGICQPGFDTSVATSAVQSWDPCPASGYNAYVSYWLSFLAGVTSTTGQAATLDLIQLLGQSRFQTLSAQGKLNIALYGPIAYAQGSAASSTRAFTVPVAGPELSVSGTYFTSLCTVPNDPSSPLSDASSGVNLGGNAPVINSASASEITSSSVAIQWLTDRPSNSQVLYGIGNTSTASTLDNTQVTFHRVVLTGLQAYKVYTFQVKSADGVGSTTDNVHAFQTLR
ncbi:MAG: fibronectin type III domain-containing protein [Bdellovibrionota bacterium]